MAGARISLTLNKEMGGDLRGTVLGMNQVRIAYDREKYWFWARPYDPTSYYFCPVEKVGQTDIEAFMRPLFMRCASGAEFVWTEAPQSGAVRIKDGLCEVEAEFIDGRPTRQTYYIRGEKALVVEFLKHQIVRGFAFPRRMKVKARGAEPLEIEMGKVSIGASTDHDSAFPEGMKGLEIQP